jgi:hypothetical protein
LKSNDVVNFTDTLMTTGGKPLRIGLDGRVLMQYAMRGFARYTVELFRAMKEIAGDDIELYSFSPASIAREFLAELEIMFRSQIQMAWHGFNGYHGLRHIKG